MPIEPGLHADVEHTVTDADTAVALGSGDVAVLATPAVVALCERAAVKAIAGALDAEQTSVGTNITLDHVAPTMPGRTVKARARLDSIDGRTLLFAVEASDDAGVIASGTHTRVVVDRQRFASGADQRS
jgi:predicted thioesterase